MLEQNFWNNEKYQRIMLNDAFTNFLFALVGLLYAKLSSMKKERYHELTSREQKIGTSMYEWMSLKQSLTCGYISDIDT